MNTQKLVDLGITEEQAGKVMELHKDTLDGDYVTKSRFNEVNDEVKQLNEQIEQRDEQLEELEEVDVEKLEETIEQLKRDNKEQMEAHKKERKQDRINSAIDLALTESKSRNNKAAKALLELDDLEIDDEGKVKGLSDQLEALRESDAYLFDVEEKPNNPSGSQPGNPKDKNDKDNSADPSKMSYSEFETWLESQN